MKRAFIFIAIISIMAVLILPMQAATQDCEGDLDACLQLLNESSDTIADFEERFIECQSTGNEGEASVGDIFDLIPAYRKLPKRTKFAITSIISIAIGVAVMYIPPPEGL